MTMKKIISIIVSCVLVMTAGVVSSFAAEAQDTSGTSATERFNDVEGTPYETAVEYLVEKGVFDGFGDGTFRPEGVITRAQVCAAVARMMGASEEELKEAAEAASVFSDVTEDDWAAPYIGYCVEKGIISGYPDMTFKGDQQIVLGEYATILCRAGGDSDTSLGGVWPDNYMKRAEEKGFFAGLQNCDPSADAHKNLTRGNAAVMTYNSMTADTPEEPEEPDTGDRLDDFSGRAFGIILETGAALDKDGDVAGSITFLMGDGTHELLTDESLMDDLAEYSEKSGLVCLRMTNGEVRKITQVDKDVTTSEDVQCILTCVPEDDEDSRPLFSKVERRSDSLVRYYTGTGDETDHFLAIEDEYIVYTCSPDGDDMVCERGSLDDVYEDCWVIAYTIDSETDRGANVILVIDQSDAEELLNTEAAGNNGPCFLK